jgi:hypothetical protein
VKYDWSADKPLVPRESLLDPLGMSLTDQTKFVDKVADPALTSDESKHVPSK